MGSTITRRSPRGPNPWAIALFAACLLVAVLLAIMVGNGRPEIAAELTYKQYATEVLRCSPQVVDRMQSKDIKQTVKAYRSALRKPEYSRLQPHIGVVIARRTVSDPSNTTHALENRVYVSFSPSGCGFTVDLFSARGALPGTTTAALPHNAQADKVAYLDTRGQRIPLQGVQQCYSNALPIVVSRDPIEVRELCSRISQ